MACWFEHAALQLGFLCNRVLDTCRASTYALLLAPEFRSLQLLLCCLQQTRYSASVLAAVRDAFPTSYAHRLLPDFALHPAPSTFMPDNVLKKASEQACATSLWRLAEGSGRIGGSLVHHP